MRQHISARLKWVLIALAIWSVLIVAGVGMAGAPRPQKAQAAAPPKPTVTVTQTVTQTVTVTATVTQTVTVTTPPPPACTSSGPIVINGQSNVVIENLCFTDIPGIAIDIRNSTNITIRNNTFTRVGDGIYIGGTVGTTGPVIIENNTFEDINPVGSTPLFGVAQAIQLDKVNTFGIVIQNNTIDGGRFEDIISFYKSGGTASSEALITRNRIRGCRPGGLCWESNTGGGITMGDSNGAASGYIRAKENLVYNARFGLAIAGGHDETIERNIIFSNETRAWTSMYVWDWNSSGGCTGHSVIGNRTSWAGSIDFVDGGNCGFTMSNNTFDDPNVTSATWDMSWPELLALLA